MSADYSTLRRDSRGTLPERMHNCTVARSDDNSPTVQPAEDDRDAVTQPAEPTAVAPTSRGEETPQPGHPGRAPARKIKPTRISGTWVAVLIAVIVLVFLLIFILQNPTPVTVHYLGLSGTLSLGVALLFASVGGAVLVATVGAARIIQLRRYARRGTSARGLR